MLLSWEIHISKWSVICAFSLITKQVHSWWFVNYIAIANRNIVHNNRNMTFSPNRAALYNRSPFQRFPGGAGQRGGGEAELPSSSPRRRSSGRDALRSTSAAVALHTAGRSRVKRRGDSSLFNSTQRSFIGKVNIYVAVTVFKKNAVEMKESFTTMTVIKRYKSEIYCTESSTI